MGVGHYENFPVASILLPARLRPPVVAVYRFARDADDVADEGDAAPAERLAALAARAAELHRIGRGETPRTPLFQMLAEQVRAHGLPLEPLHALLDAFRQDVTRTRYETFADLLDYCRLSANPVGRLMLHLHGESAPPSLAMSDAICSSLQLINFLQDVDSDYQRRGRIYLPLEDLRRHGVTEAQIAARETGPAWRALMAFQTARARGLLLEGAPLGRVLRGRFGLELRAIISGGERVLDKLAAVQGDVFQRRPVLVGTDWVRVFLRAVLR